MNPTRRPQKDSTLEISKSSNGAPSLAAGGDSVQVSQAILESRENRLDSWKEIAVYLGREVRTVQRWEKREQLPVHRHLHQKIGSIFAFKNEIDNWRESRSFCPGHPVSQETMTKRADAPLVLSLPSGTEAQAPPERSNRKLAWAWADMDSVPAIIYFSPETVSLVPRAHRKQAKNLALVGRTSRRASAVNFNARHIAAAKS